MKTLLLLVSVVALTTYTTAQPAHLTSVTYAPDTKITASDITYDEAQRTTYARGNVRIESESSTITADEADVHLLNFNKTTVHMAVDLRGNVRVVVAPPAPR